jgi:hypothetical protein
MAPRPGMPPQMGPNGFIGAPGAYANDPRMMMPNRMGNNPRPLNFPPNNMRAVRPGMYGGPYLDSPTTPTFPPVCQFLKLQLHFLLQGGLMQNGVPMNGPGMMGMPQNYDPQMIMHPASMNPQVIRVNLNSLKNAFV